MAEPTEPVEILRAEVEEIRRAAAELDATAQALRESQQRLQQLVHQCPVAVIEFDPEFCVVEWNAAAERIFGYSRDEMIGQHARIIIPEDVRPLVDQIWQDLLTQHGGTRSRNENLTASGETVVCEWYNGPRIDDQGQVAGVISLAQDVTELVRVEAERRSLERRMVESAKLESLGVLAGGIAHDFNNLLVGIVGATSLAMHQLPDDSSARPHLELVAKSADRAAELTRQMLAYSGKGRFVVEPIELGALVEEMARLVQASVSKNAQLEHRSAGGRTTIEGDATQLRQVVMNLILNASDAVAERGGSITVTTGAVPVSAASLRSTWLPDELPAGDYAFVEVTDTGEGMDAETQARIFDPFFSTKARGHGLGLAAAQGIVRAHRGFIDVESEPGSGTRIRVGFPVLLARAEREAGEDSPVDARRGFGTVLLVDDEPIVRDVARMALESAGFTVREAAHGEEAMTIFEADPAAIRAAVVDLTMPHLSGDEVLRRVRAITPGLPVILISGFDESDVTRRFGAEGPSGFLQKPFRPDELVRVVHAALGGA